SQTTGEDWEGVEMVLSTAKPNTGGTLPYVSPWVLRPYQPRPLQVKKMAYKSEVMDAMQTRAFEEEKGLAGANAPDEGAPVYATAEDRGIAVAYKLPKKVTVKSDGTEHKLPISIQTLKADFMYSTYPRLVPSAFLGSRVTNSNDLQLLSGRVNVFLEGDFVGTSAINNIGPGEEFDLYLGADDNVKIKRECVEKKVDETIIANILSPVRKTQFKYKLSAENYKSRKIKIKIFEAMPVPEDDRIKVKINQVSMEPKKKDWEDRKGVWLWEVELDPKAKQEIVYSFTVEHPRDMRVEGLD
ncbi:MAG: DUF4139 domain-containing protein, partial [Candidatus Omnitrophica bacterium]|nr:DUF4139 domain-containing protein [Candidatus Omnitrophota bacterium]